MAIEVGKQYKTRSGRDVRIYAVDGAGGYPVHGSYDLEGVGWQPAAWTAEGLFRVGDANGNDLDLVVVKPRVQQTFWVNLYLNGASVPHDSKEKADKGSTEGRIACVKIEVDVEEGHGLE